MKKCPYCGKEVKTSNGVCGYCKGALPVEAPQEATEEPKKKKTEEK